MNGIEMLFGVVTDTLLFSYLGEVRTITLSGANV
jgi:hypothetical protein